MNSLIVDQKIRLDQVVFSQYGTLSALNEVMFANPHLLNKTLLEKGDRVYLPTYNPPITTKKQGISLW